MSKFPPQLELFVSLAKLHAKTTRIFDARLGGIGMTEFIILHHLERAEGQRLRRIDLADKIGITASGITRMLAPMQKIGLVRTEEAKDDARVRYVAIAASGRRKLEEAMENALDVADSALLGQSQADTKHLLAIVSEIAG